MCEVMLKAVATLSSAKDRLAQFFLRFKFLGPGSTPLRPEIYGRRDKI